MKQFREFLTTALVSGVLIVVPSYLAILLVLKGVKSLGRLARPLALRHGPGTTCVRSMPLSPKRFTRCHGGDLVLETSSPDWNQNAVRSKTTATVDVARARTAGL